MLKAHYDILGVDKSSNKQQVIKAYREKSRQFHPDKGGTKEMMGLLNQARDSILEKLADNDFLEQDNSDVEDNLDSDVNIDDILGEVIFEDLDDPEARLSRKYATLHASLVTKYKESDEVENETGLNYFKEFVTDLYNDIELEDENVSVVEYDDLFDLIRKKEFYGHICTESFDPSITITPQKAVEYFQNFIEGKYWGQTLKTVQQSFKNHLTTSTNISEYNLYSGIFDVLTIKNPLLGSKSHLLQSLNKVTEYIRANCAGTNTAMPFYISSLLQNLYFRTLFSQALELFWIDNSTSFKASDRAELINIRETKKCFKNLSKQVILQNRNEVTDEELLRTTVFLKKLHEFEQIQLEYNESNSPDWYRQRGYDSLDGLTRMIPFASRNILINILIQAGTYFQEASICAKQTDLTISQADQKLAFHAYLEANAIANRCAPDLEMYALINTLKFIASFKYQDNEIEGVIKALQDRLNNLVDIFPIYAGLQSNIDLLTHKNNSNLSVMRALLHSLMEMIKSKTPIDHTRVTVLYQAYEACVKSWYAENYDPKLENQFRLELMQLLLENNNWAFADLDPHLLLTAMVKRNNQGWLEIPKPLRVVDCGLPTYRSFDGVEVNNKTGEIKFMLNDGSKEVPRYSGRNTFTIYDLMEMLDKNVMGASFSLDPVDPSMSYHPFNAMRFAPNDIYQTQFLNTMLLADYILKFLTIGAEVQGKFPYDMKPIAEMTKALPKHLQDIINDFQNSQRHSTGTIHRFWIEAEQISEAKIDDDNGSSKLAVSNLKMVVKKHTMERDAHGNLVDTLKDDEGWDLYILTQNQKLLFDQGKKIITGPAMVFVPELNKVFFIQTNRIYKETTLSTYHANEVTKLSSYRRDNNGMIIVNIDNSIFLYRLISDIAAASEVPTHFSPEFIFAQEFTAHYDEFSEYLLVLARLKELSKMTSAIRFLNEKKAKAIAIKDHFSRLMQAIPDWNQRDSHASKHSNYFTRPIPNSTLNKEEEAQALFRSKHAEMIRPLLPYNLYKHHLQNLAPIAEQIRTLKITINSPEITEICNDLYRKNKDSIISEHGENAWNYNKNRIWQEICSKKVEFVQEINTGRDKQMREQLNTTFSTALPALTATRINSLIDRVMMGDLNGVASELTDKTLKETKHQFRQTLIEQDRILDAIKHIGLAREESRDIKLDDKCLWVPASVRHHVAANNSLFVYGGVRVLPRVNVIGNNDTRHRQMMNSTFNSQSRVAVNDNQIRTMNSHATGGGSNRNSAHDRLQLEKMKTQYRQESNWRNPVEIKNERLKNLADSMYRGNAKIGSGSTADAVRVESANNGVRIGGNLHAKKAKDAVITLTKLLNSSTLSPHDSMVAENIRLDLLDSLGKKLWYSQTSTPKY